MDSGLLSLKWNNHSSTFFDVLETIRRKGLYSDVTIACDGKYFEVHKLVLSTCSDYFQEMFEKTQCKHPIIVLKDINYKDLEFLLNYMYVGEVNVLQNELASLIKAAECLRVKGLAVPDEPPSRKSSKRSSTNDKEESSSKRSKRNSSALASDSTSNLPSNFSSAEERNVRSKSFESNSHSSNYNEAYDTTNIKEEVIETPSEIFPVEDDLGNEVKFEKFEDVPPDGEIKDLGNNGKDHNTEDPYSSHPVTSQSQNDSLSQILPSTSGFGDNCSWSGDIETIDDDDDEGGGGDMGVNYDPNAFLDPSQAKAQMVFLSTPDFEAPHPEDLFFNESSRYMERRGFFWACTFPNCSYQNYIKTHIVKHIRTHTGDKPFFCTKCSYRSNQKSNLTKHYRKWHATTNTAPDEV